MIATLSNITKYRGEGLFRWVSPNLRVVASKVLAQGGYAPKLEEAFPSIKHTKRIFDLKIQMAQGLHMVT
jgi:hypothetical protein